MGLIFASPGSADITNTASVVSQDDAGHIYHAMSNTTTVVVNGSASSTPTTIESAKVIVYPNPWRTDKNANENITFIHVPPNARVKLFTLSGRLVKTIDSSPSASTTFSWDLTKDNGEKVSSGLYLYLVIDGQGVKTRGKIAIIK